MKPPKFLMCDTHTNPEKAFVLHTEYPRFLAECHVDYTEKEEIEFLKNPSIAQIVIEGYTEYLEIEYFDEIPMHNENIASKMATLMRELGDWYANEIDSYK